MDDEALLREYVERKSERAFAELVARHLPMVCGVAARVVGERQAAQDVAQGVFVQLARKAWMVRSGQALGGWLYRAAYRQAINAGRGEQRRRERETRAMSGAEDSTEPERGERPVAWEELAPWLEEAMGELPRVEQDAVVLRFFQGKSLQETGAALALSEEAARKRVSRGLEKMRGYFARRGVTASAGLLAEVLGAKASPAVPAGLAAAVAEVSLTGTGGAGAVVAASLLRLFYMMTKTKMGLVAMALVILVVVPVAMQWGKAREREDVMAKPKMMVNAPVKAVSEDASSATAGAGNGTAATVPAGTTAVSAPAAAATPAPAVRARPWTPGMYMAAGDWVNAGQETPEDALQTFLWARKHGNKAQLNAMIVDVAPLVIDLTKGGTVQPTEEDMARSYNAAQLVGNSLGVTPLATGDGGETTAVTPGTSPYDPGQVRQEMEAAMQNAPTTVSASPDPDYTRLDGATLVERRDISPSEVMFVVGADYASADGGDAAAAPTSSAYDFTLNNGVWMYARHTITAVYAAKPNAAAADFFKAIQAANGGTDAGGGPGQ